MLDLSSNTERLGLLKKDPVADGGDTFNIKTMLNDNWDKIDKNVATLGPDGKVPSDQLNLNTTEIENKIADLEAELGNLPELETTTKANIVAAINELKQLFAVHSADYMYQVPNIVGTQIRTNRLSDTNRLFFKLDADLTGDITISTDSGATDKPLVDIDQNQIMQLEKGFVEVVADASFFILRNRGLGGADKQALVDIVNEAEANESDLKTQFVDTVNDKAGSTLPDDATWFDVKNAIGNMTNKKWASGIAEGFSGSDGVLRVSDLDFKPSILIVNFQGSYATGRSQGVGVAALPVGTIKNQGNENNLFGFYTSTIGPVNITNNIFNETGFEFPVNTPLTNPIYKYLWIAFE